MSKATHSGHCQLCNRLQRLPNGKLAQHGYTVEFNFFNGTCPGSKFFPFEQSIGLIEVAIKNAQESAKAYRGNAAKVRATPIDPNNAWVRHYRKSTWAIKVSSYVWTKTKVWIEGGLIRYTYENEQQKKMGFCANLEKELQEYNEAYAKHLEDHAARFENYANWQKGRIKGWVAHPEKLIEVK